MTGKRSNEAEVPEEQAQDAAASTADEYKNGENPDLSYKGKLEGLGFTSLVSDPCLFERTDSRGKIMVGHDEQRTGELELDFNENSSTKHG